MRVVITEDIIRKALNESIDEFILEESMINEKWGDAVKGVWNGAKKVGNWLNNAAAMYMDGKTNGQWNQKYNTYVNGNTKTGELFYLSKWLNYYKQKLNNIIYQANTPDRRDEYDLYERDPDTGKEFMKRNKYDYTGIDGALNYAKLYCTPQNFNDYIKALNPDRESVWHINTFIQNYINNEAKKGNLKAVLHNLSIYVFYETKEFKQYLAMNRQKQQKKEKQRRINNSNKQSIKQPNSTNNTPVPNNKNGTFNYSKIECPQKRGWYYSTDAYGRNILVNSNNPTQAEFV